MVRTDWSRFNHHIAGLNLQVGQMLTLTVRDLERVLGVRALPSFVNRVTAWDPVMGKPGGLQRVVSDHALFPTAFEWQGGYSQHPTLASVTLVKWGSTVRPGAGRP
jgi:hypothetical protein